MSKEELLIYFYMELVPKIQENPSRCLNFYERAISILLSTPRYFWENNNNIEIYSHLFEANILYPSLAKSEGNRILNEAKEDLKIRKCLNSILKLQNIMRKGWVVRNVPEEYQENDIMHTTQMFALAHYYFKISDNHPFDQQKILEMILVHEIGEVLAGDKREGTKEHENKREIEEACIKEIFGSLQNGYYFINLWFEFEYKLSKEAHFVYELDKLDPILKAQYLDKVLNRDDLFIDFYEYEEKRQTFANSELKQLFYELKLK